MNGLKVVQVAELRARLAMIPAKIILSVIATFVFFWNTDVEMTWGVISADPLQSAKTFITIYGVVSYVYFFIRIFKNFFVGCVVAAAAAFAMYSLKGRFTDEQFSLIVLIMIVGGPVMDVLRFFRYVNLKREVIEESEGMRDKIDDIYENVHGYDEGYSNGYEKGYSKGRSERISERKHQRRIDHSDYEEDEYEDDGYEDGGYEDDYEEEYDDRLEDRGGYGAVSGFFEGCRTPEQLKKRYRDLCKVYHPDNGNGSEAIFEAICDEYNRLMDE